MKRKNWRKMTEIKLSPSEEKYFHITTVNLHTNEKTQVCIPVKLPKTTLRRKIKLCVDILFNRTYKR